LAERLGNGAHRLGVLIALSGQGVSQVVDVVLGGLPFSDGPVFGSQPGFSVVELTKQQPYFVHGDAPEV
jgi:hypothetical protein